MKRSLEIQTTQWNRGDNRLVWEQAHSSLAMKSKKRVLKELEGERHRVKEKQYFKSSKGSNLKTSLISSVYAGHSSEAAENLRWS